MAGYVQSIYRFAEKRHIPVVHSQKGRKKEEVARAYLEAEARAGKDRVVPTGVAQEKAAHSHMECGGEMAYISPFYFCLWDPERGQPSGRPMPVHHTRFFFSWAGPAAPGFSQPGWIAAGLTRAMTGRPAPAGPPVLAHAWVDTPSSELPRSLDGKDPSADIAGRTSNRHQSL
jgi:hypothetical protein